MRRPWQAKSRKEFHNAVETQTPAVITGNVPNEGLITNLPHGCCVEVPCLVDGNGVQPTHVGGLPPQLAALNRTNTGVQKLAVAGALQESLEHVYRAVSLDPLASALLTLDEIRAMTDELLIAEARWLPEFCFPQAAPTLDSH